MSRFCRAIGVVLLTAAGLVAAMPQAAPAAPITGTLPADLKIDVLNVVPDNALGLVTAHHILDTKKSVEGLLEKLGVPFETSNDYAEFSDFLDDLEGWDEKGTHAFAFIMIEGDDDPQAALFVPVTNYKQFAESLGADADAAGITEFEIEDGPSGFIMQKGNFAVLAEPGDGEAVLAAVSASTKSLASVSEPIRKWIGDHQVSGAVTTFGIQTACDAMLAGLAEAKNEVPDEPAARIAAKFLLPVVESVVIAARDELTHLVAAPSIDEQKGVALSARAVYKPGGKIAGVAADVPTLPADSLKHLPDQGLFVAQSSVYPEKLTSAMVDFAMPMLDALKAEADLPVDVTQFKPLLEKMRAAGKGVKYVSQVQSAGGEGIYDGMAGIYEVDDAPAYMAANDELIKELLAVAKKVVEDLPDGPVDELPEIPVTKATVSGVEVTKVEIDVPKLLAAIDDETFGQGPAADALKAMIGNDGTMTLLLGAVGPKHYVYAFSEETFDTIADNIRDGKAALADDLMIKKTAALLPSDVWAVAYFDIGGYIDMVKSMMMKMMAVQGAGQAQAIGPIAMMIPQFPQAPPIGYTMKVTGTSAEFDVVVPMEMMTATRDYVKQIQAMFGGALR